MGGSRRQTATIGSFLLEEVHVAEQGRDRLERIQRELAGLAEQQSDDPDDIDNLVDVVRRIRALSTDATMNTEGVWETVLARLEDPPESPAIQAQI